MGGSSSVISKSFVYEKLDEDQKKVYNEYERDCKEKGMNDEEINAFMAAKYRDFFGEDGELIVKPDPIVPESNEPEVRLFDVTETPSGSFAFTIRSDNNSGCTDVEQQELLRDITTAYSELDKDAEVEQINDTDVEALVDRLFLELPSETPETSKYYCPTCKLDFESQHLLDTHTNHSEIHKTALQKRTKTWKDGKDQGRRLSMIALDAIMRLNEMLKSSRSPNSAQVPRLKSAVHRAITKKITKHYEKVAETMYFSPKDVKEMHSETKLFILSGGASATYDIRMYLHYDLHCIEIIPHFLKNAPDPRAALKYPGPEVDDYESAEETSFSLSFAAGNSLKFSPTNANSNGKKKNFRHLSFGYQMSLADAGLLPTNAMHHNIEVIECPRIYLEYNEVLNVVMGLNSQFNSLDTVSDLPEPQFKNTVPGSMSPRTEAKVNHVGNRAIGGVDNMTIDDCIIAFLNSHLKCKCMGSGKHRNRDHHPSEYDLIFSGLSNNSNVLINPPRNLMSQQAATEKTMLIQWEASWINL